MTEKPSGDVSIVVPAYAEEERIGPAVRALCACARGFPRLREVLVVAEPSGDRTAEVAREAAGGDPLVRVVENAEHRGKGFAVRHGMLAAAGDITFFMDADLSVPLRYVAPFVAHLDAHPETAAAIGNRRHPASLISKRQNFLRERARIDGVAFDAEVLLIAERLGLRVDELPVEWINDEHTKFDPWRDGWRSLRDLWRVRGMHRRP